MKGTMNLFRTLFSFLISRLFGEIFIIMYPIKVDSANLVGIGITYPDTQAVYNGISVSGYTLDEINAVNGLKHAWQFIFENINAENDLPFVK